MALKKFLDQTGISHLWQKISEEFISGEELTAVVNAIDEAKEDVENKTSTIDETASDGTYPSTLAVKNYVDNVTFESELYVGTQDPAADEDKLIWFDPNGGESDISGATFIPTVENGILSWSNDKGLENPESVNLIDEIAQSDKVMSNVLIITLHAASWTQGNEGYTQSVVVNGILADETKQLIHIDGYNSSLEASKVASQIYCTAQAENSLIFTTDNIPTIDVQFIVEWKYINYLS